MNSSKIFVALDTNFLSNLLKCDDSLDELEKKLVSISNMYIVIPFAVVSELTTCKEEVESKRHIESLLYLQEKYEKRITIMENTRFVLRAEKRNKFYLSDIVRSKHIDIKNECKRFLKIGEYEEYKNNTKECLSEVNKGNIIKSNYSVSENKDIAKRAALEILENLDGKTLFHCKYFKKMMSESLLYYKLYVKTSSLISDPKRYSCTLVFVILDVINRLSSIHHKKGSFFDYHKNNFIDQEILSVSEKCHFFITGDKGLQKKHEFLQSIPELRGSLCKVVNNLSDIFNNS